MSRFFVMALSVVLFSFFTLGDAEARRFGGGKSFGKSFKYSRQAKPQKPPSRSAAQQPGNARQANGAAAQPGRMGGMMGPLAGLAAGGLLGAMFFGGAFENLQILDFLVIGLLAFLGFKLFRSLRGSSQPKTATAGDGFTPPPPPQSDTEFRSAPETVARPTTFQAPEIGSALKGEKLSIAPDWFSEPMFMDEAENHFRTIQAAWDNADLNKIKEYVTPAFFEHIRQQPQDDSLTKIIDLDSQLLDLLEDEGDAVAAILFSGLISEDGNSPEAFAEIWHVRHPLEDAEGDWLIDGISQYED